MKTYQITLNYWRYKVFIMILVNTHIYWTKKPLTEIFMEYAYLLTKSVFTDFTYLL